MTHQPQDTAAIIVAAGRGTRAGTDLPKQWCVLAGQPVLAHTIAALQGAGITRIVLVLHPDDLDLATPLLGTGISWVLGGDSRTASVRNALEGLTDSPPARVLIHDGARPLVSAALIKRVIAALSRHSGAAPALALSDALLRGAAGHVIGAQSRDGLFRAQTPQGFNFDAILAAHRAFPGDAADDVEIARAAGLDVAIVDGDEENLKLTYPADFARAAQILALSGVASQTKDPIVDIRTGNGYDVHRFGPHTALSGPGCWICGVLVPHPKTLQGHSDADVGMHALTDAIYGALCAGDIGQHFPPADPQWKGAASHIFLRHSIALARSEGFQLTHADVTLVCEMPKIGPHAVAMRAALAEILEIDMKRISVKATTSEQLGFTGRGEGIAALATATLVSA
jgi:2-C-methyl-D-erythritol 4-phosphate cytidylyltransferase/2-C-methyl-D-erythritol 2,4-cyclodiphosphate synthase